MLRKAPQEALQRGGKAPQGRLPSPGALPAAAVDVGVCPSSPTDPATGLHRSSECGAPSRATPVRFALGQGAPEDGDRPSVALAHKKDTKTRFLAVPGMGASTVMDKVNGVNKIKSLAVSRAHSVYLSRATSLMPSRRPSNDGGDEDDTDEGLFSDDDSHDDDSGEEERHPAGPGGISPAQLTMRVHQALAHYVPPAHFDDPEERPSSKASFQSTVDTRSFVRPDGQMASPVMALNSTASNSPASMYSGARSILRPTSTAAGKSFLLLPSRSLARSLINKGFGDSEDDESEEESDSFQQKLSTRATLSKSCDNGVVASTQGVNLALAVVEVAHQRSASVPGIAPNVLPRASAMAGTRARLAAQKPALVIDPSEKVNESTEVSPRPAQRTGGSSGEVGSASPGPTEGGRPGGRLSWAGAEVCPWDKSSTTGAADASDGLGSNVTSCIRAAQGLQGQGRKPGADLLGLTADDRPSAFFLRRVPGTAQKGDSSSEAEAQQQGQQGRQPLQPDATEPPSQGRCIAPSGPSQEDGLEAQQAPSAFSQQLARLEAKYRKGPKPATPPAPSSQPPLDASPTAACSATAIEPGHTSNHHPRSPVVDPSASPSANRSTPLAACGSQIASPPPPRSAALAALMASTGHRAGQQQQQPLPSLQHASLAATTPCTSQDTLLPGGSTAAMAGGGQSELGRGSGKVVVSTPAHTFSPTLASPVEVRQLLLEVKPEQMEPDSFSPQHSLSHLPEGCALPNPVSCRPAAPATLRLGVKAGDALVVVQAAPPELKLICTTGDPVLDEEPGRTSADKLAAMQKKRADAEASLARLAQRYGTPAPQPPASPPPAHASPRTSLAGGAETRDSAPRRGQRKRLE